MARTWRNPNQPGRGDCKGFLIELKEAHKENNEGKSADLITSIEKRCDEELFSEAIRLNDEYIKEKIRRKDQREKDDVEAVESLRLMKMVEWRPRIESMKKYIRKGETFNDWAREDPWAQNTGACEFVEGIPARLLNNSEIDEIWMIASKEVEKKTVTESGLEPEPASHMGAGEFPAALKSKKRKRRTKKNTKKKNKSKKKTKKKKNTKKKY